jgi:hypothetical protein
MRLSVFGGAMLVVSILLVSLPASLSAGDSRLQGRASMGAPEPLDPRGEYAVSVFADGQWKDAGKLPFDKFCREQWINLGGFIRAGDRARIRLTQSGGGAAHIDSVLLGTAAPCAVTGTDDELALKKLRSMDCDLIDAFGKAIELTFPPCGESRCLVVAARIEDSVISKAPFLFPLVNIHTGVGPESEFYSYLLNSNRAQGDVLFREFVRPGTGHPAGYTYCWVWNDAKNLHVKMDFTSDNTMDGDKDYAKVFVNTARGVREFKVSTKETKWGKASFTYTDRVAYQHKVYDFSIPLKECMSANGRLEELRLAFAAYGTAAVNSATWNGSVSTDWFNTANWTFQGSPILGSGTYATIPNLGPTANYPVQAPNNIYVGPLYIASGASFSADNAYNIYIYGCWQAYGSVSGNPNVYFNYPAPGIGTTIKGASSQTFNYIEIVPGASVSVDDGVSITVIGGSGVWVRVGGFFRMGTGTLLLSTGSMSIEGSFDLAGGTVQINAFGQMFDVAPGGFAQLASTLILGAGTSVLVGGSLETSSTTIRSTTPITDRFGFVVNSGAFLRMSNTTVNSPNSSGVRLNNGAFADIQYCSFLNAVNSGCHVYIDGGSSYSNIFRGCSFDNSFGAGSGNNVKLSGSSATNVVLVLPDASGAGAGESYDYETPFTGSNVLWSLSPDAALGGVAAGTTVADYAMLSVPVLCSAGELRSQLEASLGPYATTQWRMFLWDPYAQGYVELPYVPADKLFTGTGAFLISRNAAALSVAGSNTSDFPYVQFELYPGWNMISNPYNADPLSDPVLWSSHVQVWAGGSWQSALSSPLVNDIMYCWSAGAYGSESQLYPNESYWIQNTSASSLPIRILRPAAFPPKPGAGIRELTRAPLPPGAELPPGPPSLQSSSGSGGGGGGGGGGCVVRTASGGSGLMWFACMIIACGAAVMMSRR